MERRLGLASGCDAPAVRPSSAAAICLSRASAAVDEALALYTKELRGLLNGL
jgi:hypothetical protein